MTNVQALLVSAIFSLGFFVLEIERVATMPWTLFFSA